MNIIFHNIKQLLIAIDQLLNVLICSVFLFWRKSWADETFSSRCHRWRMRGIEWPAKFVDFIFLLLGDQDHCLESFESERLGRQLPPEERPITN